MNFLEYVDKQIKLIETNEPLYRDFFLLKKGRRVFRALPPFSNRGSANDPHKGNVMIIFGGFRARPLDYWLTIDCDLTLEILCQEKPV